MENHYYNEIYTKTNTDNFDFLKKDIAKLKRLTMEKIYTQIVIEIKKYLTNNYNYYLLNTTIKFEKVRYSNNQLNQQVYINMEEFYHKLNSKSKNKEISFKKFYKNSYDLAEFEKNKSVKYIRVGSIRFLMNLIEVLSIKVNLYPTIKMLQEQEIAHINYKKLNKMCQYKERKPCLNNNKYCHCEIQLSFNELNKNV
jgi:hypothetical protein